MKNYYARLPNRETNRLLKRLARKEKCTVGDIVAQAANLYEEWSEKMERVVAWQEKR
jgi:hypothetical protein